MTPGARAVLAKALDEIINLPQPDEHDCDDDEVISILTDLLGEDE
jgi:hypothetical protein